MNPTPISMYLKSRGTSYEETCAADLASQPENQPEPALITIELSE